MMTPCFYHNVSCIFYFLLPVDEEHFPPLIHFSTFDNILMSANNSNFTFILLKAACHANPGEA